MAATAITFANELKPVKSNRSGDDIVGGGGVYNTRSRRASKTSVRDKSAFFAEVDAVPPEDEDSGLRNEADYKSKQVRCNTHPASLGSAQWLSEMIVIGILEARTGPACLAEYRNNIWRYWYLSALCLLLDFHSAAE
jgi:hypothetical protein